MLISAPRTPSDIEICERRTEYNDNNCDKSNKYNKNCR